jgi:hypothetical protein
VFQPSVSRRISGGDWTQGTVAEAVGVTMRPSNATWVATALSARTISAIQRAAMLVRVAIYFKSRRANTSVDAVSNSAT